MFSGAHVMLYSKNAEADRAFLRDVIGFPAVDSGGGWLIFKLPPVELGVHPSERNDHHEFYLMCDDLDSEIARLQQAGVETDPVAEQGWGRSTAVALPGGGRLGLYQASHARS